MWRKMKFSHFLTIRNTTSTVVRNSEILTIYTNNHTFQLFHRYRSRLADVMKKNQEKQIESGKRFMNTHLLWGKTMGQNDSWIESFTTVAISNGRLHKQKRKYIENVDWGENKNPQSGKFSLKGIDKKCEDKFTWLMFSDICKK